MLVPYIDVTAHPFTATAKLMSPKAIATADAERSDGQNPVECNALAYLYLRRSEELYISEFARERLHCTDCPVQQKTKT
jgi:hypothetical protein